MAGYCQLLTSVIGMGWIWSIYHGMSLVNNASIYANIKKIQEEPDVGIEDDFGGVLPEEEQLGDGEPQRGNNKADDDLFG